MSERKTLSGKDWAGLALFGAGSLGAVLMFLALRADKPLPAYGVLGSIAQLWTSTFGIFPTLFLNGAFMFLAFRMFVMEARGGLGRNLLACLGVAVALSVLLGAFSRTAGGMIGDRTGWFVSDAAHLTVAVLLGLVAVFAAVWFGWIRATNVVPAAAEDAEETSAVAQASKVSAKTMVRPAVHKTTAANEGVSLAESAALFPDEDDVPVVRKLEPTEAPKAVIPPSPYPEDVRRKGLIPPGARPLSDANASVDVPLAPAAPVAPTIYHFGGAKPAPEAVPAKLAQEAASAKFAQEAASAKFAREAASAKFSTGAQAAAMPVSPAPAARAAAESLAARPRPVEDVDLDARDTELDVAEEVESRAAPTRPTASWEEDDEPAAFEPEEGDEEPVDAYGTPLSLVETLRQARRQAGLEGGVRDGADVAADARAADAEEDETTDTLEVVSSAALVEDVRLAEFEGGSAQAEADELEAELAEDVDDEADEDEVDDLFDEDVEEDAEEDLDAVDEDEPLVVSASDEEQDLVADADVVVRDIPVRSAAVPRELDAVETGSTADAQLAALDAALLEERRAIERDEVLGDAAVTAQASTESVGAEARDEGEIALEAATTGSPAKGKGTGRGKSAVKVDEPAQPSLFDVVEIPVVAGEAAPAARDVVLQPQPTVPADRTTKAPRVEADPRLAQLSEIGCLFVERGRVAVSMLQRQYEMDFDAACKVLDDLQEMGLIGPYLGGQRRDILLTREQWLERVSQAGAAR